MEFIGLGEPGNPGVVTGEWKTVDELQHHSKITAAQTKERTSSTLRILTVIEY